MEDTKIGEEPKVGDDQARTYRELGCDLPALEEPLSDPAAEDLDSRLDDLLGDDAETLDEGFADRYITGSAPRAGDSDFETYEAWLRGISPDYKRELDKVKAEMEAIQGEFEAKFEKVKIELKKSAAELLEGRLPPDQASKLPGDYALGLNQSEYSQTLEDAQRVMNKGGVVMENLSPTQRFMFLDTRAAATSPEAAEKLVLGGFYKNPDDGRFIYVFPGSGDPKTRPIDETYDLNSQPKDFYLDGVNGHGQSDLIVNPKYCAGFIDSNGRYHRNVSFMEKSEFKTEEAEVEPADIL